MEYQFQNWYHFNWLSGDQTAQQLIHSIDKASWALGDVPPVKAWGMGGRQVCIEPKYGDQFDHHAVVFEYANGVRVFGFCRDILGCYNETTDVIFGTKGRAFCPTARASKARNPGAIAPSKGPKPNMYDVEHKELFDAIRAGKTINNGNYMFTSTMLAILGPDGLLHGPGDHLGAGDAVEADLPAAALRLGRRAAGQAGRQRPVRHGHAGNHPVPLTSPLSRKRERGRG